MDTVELNQLIAGGETLEVEFKGEEQEVQVGLIRLPVPDYSPSAIREALLNALFHRDYRQDMHTLCTPYARGRGRSIGGFRRNPLAFGGLDARDGTSFMHGFARS